MTTANFVFNYIRNSILQGNLKAGDYLPPERELATQLEVSRSSVREAIHSLHSLGVLTSTVGHTGGTKVSKMQAHALSELLRVHIALADYPIKDIAILRTAMEKSVISIAAQKCTPPELTTLNNLITNMQNPNLPIEQFNDLDTKFHVEIARIANNSLIGDLTTALRESLRIPILKASKTLKNWTTFSTKLNQQHKEILKAIKKHASEEATHLSENHIQYSIKELSSSWNNPTQKTATFT